MSPVIIQNETDPALNFVVKAKTTNADALRYDAMAATARYQRDTAIRTLRGKPYSWTYQAIATAVGLSYAQVYTICKKS